MVAEKCQLSLLALGLLGFRVSLGLSSFAIVRGHLFLCFPCTWDLAESSVP
jgi:hypothetical protein